MAHTPEECARRILEVFRALGPRKGARVRRTNAYSLKFRAGAWTHDEFEEGIDEAVNRGWISDAGYELLLSAQGEEAIIKLPRQDASSKG